MLNEFLKEASYAELKRKAENRKEWKTWKPNGRTLTMTNDEILQHLTLKNVKGYIRLTCMYRSVNVNLPHNEVLKIYELLPPLCPHSIRQEYTITFSHLRITLDLYKNLYIKVFTNYLIINHVSTSAFLSDCLP